MFFRGSFSSSSPFFLFFFLFAINGLILISALPDEIPGSTRLELIHRNSRKLSGNVVLGGRPKTQLEDIKQFHRRDVIRHRNIVSRRLEGVKTTSSVAVMPVHSGADFGTGEYFVHVNVGTPRQKLMLIVDTGSELTWMNCRYKCGRRCGTHKGTPNNQRVFTADRSSSFKTVPCSSHMCKVELANLFSLNRCPTPSTPCAYDYRCLIFYIHVYVCVILCVYLYMYTFPL